ncbi:Ras-related protein Rab-7a, partial [Aphelenchoides avenae]
MLRRHVHGEFTDPKPTVGIEFEAKPITVDGTQYSLQFWDTTGQHDCRAVTAQYYRNAHCCVLVYDITDLKSFSSLDSWLNDFLFKS